MTPMPAPLDDESGNHFRRKPRPGRRVPVRWRWASAPMVGGQAALCGWTANLGVGGAFIETAETRPRGAELAMEIELPGMGRTIALHAQVRWATAATAASAAGEAGDRGPAGMGVHFLGVTDETISALNEYFGTLTDTVDHDEAP